MLIAAAFGGYWIGNNHYLNRYKKVTDKLTVGNTPSDQELTITNDDEKDYVSSHAMPSLRRMSDEDYQKYVANLKVIDRTAKLGLQMEDVLRPEKSWKTIYTNVMQPAADKKSVEFDGTKASELNAFIEKNTGKSIYVSSQEIEMDEQIRMKDGISLVGNATHLSGGDVQYFLLMENLNNCQIDNFVFDNGNYGVFALNCSNLIISNCKFINNANRAVVISGGKEIQIKYNEVSGCAYGGLHLVNAIDHCVVVGNKIHENKGTANLCAGVVISANVVEDDPMDTDTFVVIPLNQKLSAPHNVVVYGNDISENRSSGIYCDGNYQTYLVKNRLQSNDKEGLCMDWGTIGTFVSQNIIEYNGFRIDQTDEDLKNDFVDGLGRLPDGSSPSKLPGVSMDNTIWNIIEDNVVSNNAGSGIKSVRTSSENIIYNNIVADNNRGVSDTFHFFGIELGAANNGGTEQDKVSAIMDFIGSYENIIASNVITGAHFDGIFLEKDNTINDIYDNTIAGATTWSMEALGDLYNSSVNNHSGINSRGIPLNDVYHVSQNGIMVNND